MSESQYRTEVDQKRIQQIRTITRNLPPSCMDFMHGIAVTTGTFTRLAYAIDLRTFFHYLVRERVVFSGKPLTSFTDADVASISSSDLEAYVEYLTLYFPDDATGDNSQPHSTPTTPPKPLVNHELAIKRKLSTLRSYFDYLFMTKRIPSNVTHLIALPKIHEKPILRLTMDEVKRLLDVVQTGENLTKGQARCHEATAARDYAMLSLFLGTGMRVSECVGIDIEDLNLAANAVLITRKGGNQAVLYYPPEVAQALEAYLTEREKMDVLPGHQHALFLSLQRRRITQRAVQNLVKKYAAYAAPLKPRISPHKLRSTYGTNLYHATGDIYLVADALGHSSVDTTRKHYADMTEERRRLAAEHVHLPVNQAALDAPQDAFIGATDADESARSPKK